MRFLIRLLFVAGGLAGVLAVTLAAGVRQGLLTLLGIGFGAVLQGARFGFTTGWRDYIERRDPQGLWAQMLLLALAAALTLPLLAGHPGELVGAVAPLTISLVLGAFLFGAAMQLADGCGSGTLYKAGAGSPLSVVVLPTFALEGQTVRLAQALAQAKVVKGGGGSGVQMGSIWLPWGFDQKAGQASVGYVRIVQFDPTEKRKMVQDFVKAFQAKYGADKTPTHINAHAYDTILLIAEAVRRGAKDSEGIRAQFSKLKDFEVTTGKITFDRKGQNSDLSVVHFVETQPDLSWKSIDWR